MSQVFYRHGDIKAGFAQADRIFEHTFYVPPVHQGYLEPHACVASIAPSGKINIWLSNKSPFVARSQIAVALDVPEERVLVNPITIGGASAGKGSLLRNVPCRFLAKRA